MNERPTAENDAHLTPEWAEVVAATTRAALALHALDVAVNAYAAIRVIPSEGGNDA